MTEKNEKNIGENEFNVCIVQKNLKNRFFTNHIFIHDIGRRPLQSGLRFSKFQNYSCTKLGMTKFAKFGRQLVYWQPTQTGNINFLN